MIFLNEIPGWISLIGALLVTTSVLLTGVRKWVEGLDNHDPLRQRLCFVFFFCFGVLLFPHRKERCNSSPRSSLVVITILSPYSPFPWFVSISHDFSLIRVIFVCFLKIPTCNNNHCEAKRFRAIFNPPKKKRSYFKRNTYLVIVCGSNTLVFYPSQKWKDFH